MPPPRDAYEDAAPPAPSDGGADRLTQLKELGELKESGVLSDFEFEAEKRRILNS